MGTCLYQVVYQYLIQRTFKSKCTAVIVPQDHPVTPASAPLSSRRNHTMWAADSNEPTGILPRRNEEGSEKASWLLPLWQGAWKEERVFRESHQSLHQQSPWHSPAPAVHAPASPAAEEGMSDYHFASYMSYGLQTAASTLESFQCSLPGSRFFISIPQPT